MKGVSKGNNLVLFALLSRLIGKLSKAYLRANFSAASLASAPELQKNTFQRRWHQSVVLPVATPVHWYSHCPNAILVCLLNQCGFYGRMPMS
ncbi:hypothetical protein [Yersinia enterocolitica]|uniref:hypothetical protein n=1 Tax=Yersinia enterocolitica TaxID=630 RepID=UPI0038CD928E